ncbi:ABC transporter permease (plasmid) [Streptomyces sp. BI20]|uniref:ABC transporter permease n=1 Tax=Streptomyces sp. BI20 TaxID=3403460 RepID=UPI003C74225D
MSAETNVRPQRPTTRRSVAATWRTVAGRELRVKATDKTYLGSAFITLLLVIGAVFFQSYMGANASRVDLAVARTAPDAGRALTAAAERMAAAAGQDGVGFDRVEVADADAVRAVVRSGEVDAGLVWEGGRWTLLGLTSQDDTAGTWIPAAAAELALDANAKAAGTTVGALRAGGEVPYELLEPSRTPLGVVQGISYMFGLLFYLLAIIMGSTLANAVVEEKQSRVVEIIAATVRLRDLLIGKIVAAVVLGLGQLLLACGVGAVALAALGDTELLGRIGGGLGWFLAFYLLGAVVLATAFAAAGAMATRVEDVASSTGPLTMVVMAACFGGAFATGTVQTVLSYVPIASVITMPGRVLAGEAAAWEPPVSLAISAFVAWLVVLGAERVYRRALLDTGGRLSLRKAWRLED